MNAHTLMTVVLWLMPPSRKEWGQAMMGEFETLADRHNSFALGCVGTALRENVTTGDGWARIGFGSIAASALAAFLLIVGIHFEHAIGLHWYLTSPDALLVNPQNPPTRPDQILGMIFGSVLSFLILASMAAILFIASTKAMQHPIDKSLIIILAGRTIAQLMLIGSAWFWFRAAMRFAFGADGINEVEFLVVASLYSSVWFFGRAGPRALWRSSAVVLTIFLMIGCALEALLTFSGSDFQSGRPSLFRIDHPGYNYALPLFSAMMMGLSLDCVNRLHLNLHSGDLKG